MKKLKLDLEKLQVESFTVPPDATSAGTVAAREIEYANPEGTLEDACFYGGGGTDANTVNTSIGPTYCCQITWRPTCSCTKCVGGDTCNWTCGRTCEPVDVCSL